jgi:putative IMPACT (imprinted ancient) family translation regulator
VKLGVGGLIAAYRTAAQQALEGAAIEERTVDILFKVKFDYKNLNKVMRVIKEKNLSIISQTMELNCEIIISIRKKNAERVFTLFSALFEIEIEQLH